MPAHDDDGNEVFSVMINTICPIEYATEARQIAHHHMTNVEVATDSIDQMLKTTLGPIDSSEVTHIFCARSGYTHQVAMEVATLVSQNLDWCGSKEYTINDSVEEIKSKFCCITGDTGEILTHLGLSSK